MIVRLPFQEAVVALSLISGSASAQTVDLPNYLKAMDLTEVTFSGHIKFDDNSMNDIPFVFYNAEGDAFPATIDAGRKTRELIETECEASSFIISLKDLCEVEGRGTVEIRGSRIHLSVDQVTILNKP